MVSGEVVLGGAGVLGVGAAVGPAEHLVARLEPGHGAAHRLDVPGQVHAPNGGPWPVQPEGWDDDADQIWRAGHDMVRPCSVPLVFEHMFV